MDFRRRKNPIERKKQPLTKWPREWNEEQLREIIREEILKYQILRTETEEERNKKCLGG